MDGPLFSYAEDMIWPMIYVFYLSDPKVYF